MKVRFFPRAQVENRIVDDKEDAALVIGGSGLVAQLAVQLILNQKVVSSTLTEPTEVKNMSSYKRELWYRIETYPAVAQPG